VCVCVCVEHVFVCSVCVCVCVCVSAVLCVVVFCAPSIMTSVYFRLLSAIIMPLRVSLTFVQLTIGLMCYISPLLPVSSDVCAGNGALDTGQD